jgi:hypothetical protein
LFNYEKLNKNHDIEYIRILIKKWIKKFNIRNYDLSVNNIMINKVNNKILVKMLDFQYSPDVTQNTLLNADIKGLL